MDPGGASNGQETVRFREIPLPDTAILLDFQCGC